MICFSRNKKKQQIDLIDLLIIIKSNKGYFLYMLYSFIYTFLLLFACLIKWSKYCLISLMCFRKTPINTGWRKKKKRLVESWTIFFTCHFQQSSCDWVVNIFYFTKTNFSVCFVKKKKKNHGTKLHPSNYNINIKMYVQWLAWWTSVHSKRCGEKTSKAFQSHL